MPPTLSISVPVNAAVAADAEPDLNRGAAPGGASAGVPAGRTAALFRQLSALFAEQRAAGVDVHAGQGRESFRRLDAAVRELLAAYCADPDADWERCGTAARQRARYAQGACASLGTEALRRPTRPALLRLRYAFWGAEHYLRNLVDVEEGAFELMARVACCAHS